MEVANTGNLTLQMVSNLSEGSILLSTEDVRENYCSLLDKVKKIGTLATIALKLLNTVCADLFDPEEGFIALKKQTVSLLALSGEMLKLRNDIPGDMLPKLDEIEKYLAESKTLIDTMEKDIPQLIELVKEKAFESDFNISETDLKKIKFRQRKILRDRSVCKKYLTRTQETFDEIEKNVSGKLLLTGLISTSALIGGGVLAKKAVETALVGLLDWTSRKVTENDKASTAVARTVVGSAAAATGLFYISAKLFVICCRHSIWLSEFQETLQSKLNIINMEVVKIEESIKLLEKDLSDATE